MFCGGSDKDAPVLVPWINQLGLSTVDSYDNHNEIINGNYLDIVRKATDKSGTTAIVGVGWDPGYLSVQRILNKAIMPAGIQNTLYGPGLSMGHTNAIKNIDGVLAAHQITVPRKDAQTAALEGTVVNKNDCHRRICHIVAEQGKEAAIEEQILNMEGYFKNQPVEICFIGINEFNEKFSNKMNHGGQIISVDENAKINLNLEMKSNPMFTANCMLAYARANLKMQQEWMSGVYTNAQIPPAWLVSDKIHINEI